MRAIVYPIGAIVLLLVAPAGAVTRAHRQQHVLAAAFYQCLDQQWRACR